MTTRPTIQVLLDELSVEVEDLSEAQLSELEWSVQVAGALLVKHHLLSRIRRPDESSSMPVAERRAHIRLRFEGLLTEEQFDLVLGDEERNALIDRLIELLDGAPRAAAAAAGAFVYSDVVAAVPRLSEMLRRLARLDGRATHQGIVAIETILTRAVSGTPPLPNQVVKAVSVASDALCFARDHAVSDIYDARQVAARALSAIQRRLGRAAAPSQV